MLNRRNLLQSGAAAIAGLELARTQSPDPSRAPEKTDADRDARLRALLATNRRTHPTYGGGLANHLSMALCSLAALGATTERLEAFAQAYSKHLDSLRAGGPEIGSANWRESLGQRAAVGGFVSYFERRMHDDGRAAVLRETLPELIPILGTQLFHGMIRAAFGVLADDDAETAHGLAYWASYAESMGPLAESSGTEANVGALLARIRGTEGLARAGIRDGSGTGRVHKAARLPKFGEVASALAVREDTLPQLASAALALYATTRSFSALHAVTATHAFRVLLPFAPSRELALRHQWRALAAVYVGVDAPELAAEFPEPPATLDAVVARTLLSDDDHAAKFVFACREEERAYSNPLYRLAAAQRVGLA